MRTGAISSVADGTISIEGEAIFTSNAAGWSGGE